MGCGGSVLVVTADCFSKGAGGSLSSLMSDLFLVTPSQDLPPLCSLNCRVPLSPDNTLRASVFPFSYPDCTSTGHNHLHALTSSPQQIGLHSLSFSLPSPLSQPLLTSLRLEICLSILIPLCQEFWIFITRIHPFFFSNDLEKGGHLLIAHTLLGFDNTFCSR